MNQRLLFGFGLLFVLGVTAVCEGGIVVLKDGQVFVGKIESHETTLDTIYLHNPRGQKGQMEIDRRKVRWSDDEADTLTDAYFDDHMDEDLRGPSWIALREKTRVARSRSTDPIDLPEPDMGDLLNPQLALLPSSQLGFSIRAPYGWQGNVHGDIFVLKAPQATGNGFTPRIHVFSVKSPTAPPDDQVAWIEAELTKLAGGKKKFAVLELSRPRVLANGTNQRLRTATQIRGRTVKAIRQVYFRDGRTYFFAAYVDDRDYPRLEKLIEESLKTLTLQSD